MSEQLKPNPCRQCGCDKTITKNGKDGFGYFSQIQCLSCYAEAPPDDTVEGAIDRWNLWNRGQPKSEINDAST